MDEIRDGRQPRKPFGVLSPNPGAAVAQEGAVAVEAPLRTDPADGRIAFLTIGADLADDQ